MIEVISGATGRTLGTIHTRGTPTFMAVDPATHRLYAEALVFNPDGTSTTHIEVIDAITRRSLGRIWAPFATGPLVADQRHNLIYALTTGQGLAVIDGHSDKVIRRIPLPRRGDLQYDDAVLDPRNGTLYVIGNGSPCDVSACTGYLVAVNPASGTSSAPVRVGTWAYQLSVDPTMSRLYVTTTRGTVVFSV